MLARTPQSTFLDGVVGISQAPPGPPRRFLLLGRSWSIARTTTTSSSTDGKREVMASARGRRFERVPLETAGAYELVDKESGEKVIVWGGADDDVRESPVPSDEVLSWSPRSRKEEEKENEKDAFDATGVEMNAAVAEFGAKPTGRLGQSVGSFGRLKAQKIKSLIRRSARISKESTNYNRGRQAGNIPFDGADHIEPFDLNSGKTSLGFSQQEELNNNANNERVRDTHTLHVEPEEYTRAANVGMPASKVSSSTKGWGDAGSDKYTTLGRQYQQRKTSVDSGFFSRKSFKDLGCSDDMIKSLGNLRFLRPSHIQALAYQPVLEGKSCIIADQSGSGKTLAYLAPVIQCIRQEELLGISKSSSGSPRVIILTPTAELSSQVLNNCRSISKGGVPFRSMVATGGFRQKTQLDSLQQELDVLIATPGRFIYLLQEGFLQLTNLKCIVLDEVDILFGDEGFEQVLQRLIDSAPVSAQYIFVTATLPVDIYNKVVGVFPDCGVIMGPGMHRTSSGLEEVLVDCSGDDREEKNPDTAFLNKKSALLRLVDESPVPKTIIFCNKIETCRKVENMFNRFDRKGEDIKVLPFHAALAQEMRLANLKEFHSGSTDPMFLICTDRASRGIDFSKVDHVVLFDFPRDPSEYVRRVGRTARGAGGRGKAYVFVVGKQVPLARRIIERNKKGHPLHDVPCSYENSVL
ncbi:DEAD-box ATP-dependent RNA helicase 50 isoform X1 [Typha angustifolia]|uniref:DEAD-box ATP-dependent RNA helicase 50 isoform X1 n=1 Tax=Typha angustifolia TaxID=59011 RepID=UPI003C2C565F